MGLWYMKVDLVLRATCKLFPFANLVTEMYDQMLQKSKWFRKT